MAVAAAGLAECDLGDLFDLLPGVAAVVTRVAARRVLTFHLFSKVDAADQLPDHEDVDAVSDHLRTQRRQTGEPARKHDRTVVGEGVVALAQFQDGELGTLVHRDGVHLFQRHAGRPFQNRICAVADRLRLHGEGGPAGEISPGPERGAPIGEAMAVTLGHGVQHLQRLGNDFGADAVAFEDGD